MPISDVFFNKLECILPELVKQFGTPFHIYNERGILKNSQELKRVFKELEFNNFFAIKANSNPAILGIMRKLGFGFDCSSIPELNLARQVGAGPEEIMFTSNNTSQEEFLEAALYGGCLLNLDDISLVEKVPEFPETICFRYNPGPLRQGLDGFIGEPEKCKYGVTHEQIVRAYQLAINRGAKKFGIHTMVVSNERDYRCMVETVNMLLNVVKQVSAELNITFDFINSGGGLGIPYNLNDQPIDLERMGKEIIGTMAAFRAEMGWVPRLLMENGRWVTGPFGALVATCITIKSTYQEFRGLDASCVSSMMRPVMYHGQGGGYHYISVFGQDGKFKQDGRSDWQSVSVVGPECEDNGRFCWERLLPPIEEGDLAVVHDTGAHCYAMASNYNGRLRPQELLLRSDGSVELIRRAETVEDLFATLEFEPKSWQPEGSAKGSKLAKKIA